MASLLFFATFIAPFAACFLKFSALILVALCSYSSDMLEHLDKNKKNIPDATNNIPTIKSKILPLFPSPAVTYRSRPTKILKSPLPPPVNIIKKFLDMQGILNDEPIIMSPNKL